MESIVAGVRVTTALPVCHMLSFAQHVFLSISHGKDPTSSRFSLRDRMTSVE